MSRRKGKKKRAPSALASEFTLERCAEAMRSDSAATELFYDRVQRLIRGENWSHRKKKNAEPTKATDV